MSVCPDCGLDHEKEMLEIFGILFDAPNPHDKPDTNEQPTADLGELLTAAIRAPMLAAKSREITLALVREGFGPRDMAFILAHASAAIISVARGAPLEKRQQAFIAAFEGCIDAGRAKANP